MERLAGMFGGIVISVLYLYLCFVSLLKSVMNSVHVILLYSIPYYQLWRFLFKHH